MSKGSDHVTTPAFWSELCANRLRFRRVVKMLRDMHGIPLFVPILAGTDDQRLTDFRRFCSDPLEGKKHPWDEVLRRVPLRTRWSIHFSLFLFRKTLPPKDPSIKDYIRSITSAPPSPDRDFLEHARKEVERLFPIGWDKKYDLKVGVSTLSTAACSQKSRSAGGSRAYWLEANEEARGEFCAQAIGKYTFSVPPPSRVMKVETSGKIRILTKPPAEFSLLQPFSSCMYDHLSQYDWLLRGDAKSKSFRGFEAKEGEFFVSGDYESATDNLNSEVQKEIMQAILDRSLCVPADIKRLAYYSLQSQLSFEGEDSEVEVVQQRNGQMMGFLTSFPLLCLVNYIAFTYVMGTDTPVRINGDDIVFRSTPVRNAMWMASVERAGLVLSVGKTLVNRRFFTLNSSLFQAGRGLPVAIPFVRSKALFGKEDSLCSLPGRYKSFAPNYFGRNLRVAQRVFLVSNRGLVERTGRSLTRGLGMSVSEQVLKEACLWTREVGFLALPRESPPPPPRSMWSQRPDGFEIAHSDKPHKPSKKEKDELREAVLAAAWRPPPRQEQYVEEFKTGLVVPGLSKGIDLMSRMAKISERGIRRWIEASSRKCWSEYLSSRTKLFPYWKKTTYSGSSCFVGLSAIPEWQEFERGRVSRREATKLRFTSEEEKIEEMESDDEYDQVFADFGPGTLWDRTGDEPILITANAGCKVMNLKGGIGIGPPTCF